MHLARVEVAPALSACCPEEDVEAEPAAKSLNLNRFCYFLLRTDMVVNYPSENVGRPIVERGESLK